MSDLPSIFDELMSDAEMQIENVNHVEDEEYSMIVPNVFNAYTMGRLDECEELYLSKIVGSDSVLRVHVLYQGNLDVIEHTKDVYVR